MEIVKLICQDDNIEGVVIGENSISVKLITTNNKVALIPKSKIIDRIHVRDLTKKEEIEILTLIRTNKKLEAKLREMAEIQKEIDSLYSYINEQEVYLGNLLYSKTENEPTKKHMNLKDISPSMTEPQFKALKHMCDNNLISINGDGDIIFLDPYSGKEVDKYDEPSKEEFLKSINIIVDGVFPIMDIINTLFPDDINKGK